MNSTDERVVTFRVEVLDEVTFRSFETEIEVFCKNPDAVMDLAEGDLIGLVLDSLTIIPISYETEDED